MIRPDETPKSWYTETPKTLVAGIVRDEAWDRLPILADALEDSGCDNYLLLNTLRLCGPPRSLCGPWLERVASGLESVPEVDLAIEHLSNLAEEFYGVNGMAEYERAGMDKLDWMVEVLKRFMETGESFHCSGYNNPDSTQEMWRYYCSLTGTRYEDCLESYEYPPGRTITYPKSAFGCSC